MTKSNHYLLMLIVILSFLLVACSQVPTTEKIAISQAQLAVFKQGNLTPTLVFESGLGDGKNTWQPLLAKLPPQLSVFAYDRPGYGDSKTNQSRPDPCYQANQLKQLLQAAEINPPYLLVGHSLGGLYQYAFAKQFPELVYGLVLLDPTFPLHWQNIQARAPSQAKLISGMRSLAFDRTMREEFDAQADCNDSLMNDETQPTMPTHFIWSNQFQWLETSDYRQLVAEEREAWTHLLENSVNHTLSTEHYIHQQAPQEVAEIIQQLLSANKTDPSLTKP